MAEGGGGPSLPTPLNKDDPNCHCNFVRTKHFEKKKEEDFKDFDSCFRNVLGLSEDSKLRFLIAIYSSKLCL